MLSIPKNLNSPQSESCNTLIAQRQYLMGKKERFTIVYIWMFAQISDSFPIILRDHIDQRGQT